MTSILLQDRSHSTGVKKIPFFFAVSTASIRSFEPCIRKNAHWLAALWAKLITTELGPGWKPWIWIILLTLCGATMGPDWDKCSGRGKGISLSSSSYLCGVRCGRHHRGKNQVHRGSFQLRARVLWTAHQWTIMIIHHFTSRHSNFHADDGPEPAVEQRASF